MRRRRGPANTLERLRPRAPAAAVVRLRVGAAGPASSPFCVWPQKLAETGFAFATLGTLEIHLANTLAGPPPTRTLFDPEDSELMRTVRAGQEACYAKPYTVVVGQSAVLGHFSGFRRTGSVDCSRAELPAETRVAGYYEVDGQPLRERKHWAPGRLCEFLRYATGRSSQRVRRDWFVTNHGLPGQPDLPRPAPTV